MSRHNYIEPKRIIEPRTVDYINNYSFYYYREQLQLKLYSQFVFENFPENWDIGYFRNTLFNEGYIIVTDSTAGVVALRGGITGINCYNAPTKVIIANSVLGEFMRKLGKNAELVYLNRHEANFYNYNMLLDRYAAILSNIDASLSVTLLNSRVAHVFEASNDAQLKSAQRLYDDVSKGKPAVFLKKGNETAFELNNAFLNVKQTYIGNDLLETKRTVINEFLTEIGIQNNNNIKKERMITDEVNSNNSEVFSIASLIRDNLNDCFKRVNAMFPEINIRCSLRSELEKAGDSSVYHME